MKSHTAPIRTSTLGLVLALAAVLIGEPEPAPIIAPAREWAAGLPSALLRVSGAPAVEAAHIEVWLGQRRVFSDEGPLPRDLELPLGRELTLVVEAPGRSRSVTTLPASREAAVEAQLPPAPLLDGQVLDERDQPVAHAEVQLTTGSEFPWERWDGRTDADGRFHFDTLGAASYDLVARAGGHAQVQRADVVPPEIVRLTMERVATLAGRVIRPDGRPASDAEVIVVGSAIWPGRRVPIQSDGSFRLEGIDAGVYELHATAGGLVAEPRRGVSLDPASRRFITLSLEQGGAIVGIVRDAETALGIPGADILVTTGSVGLVPRSTVSGEDGRFRLSGLLGVTHHVTVEAPGYVPVRALPIEAGTHLEIELSRGATLAGVVVDPEGNPVADALIEVIGEDNHDQPVALSEAEGFRASLVATHLMVLPVTSGPIPPIPTAAGSGAGLGELSLGTVAQQETERTIELQYRSGEDGTFLIPGVPAGHVQVTARREGRAPATTERLFVTVGMSRDDLRLVMPLGGQLTGEVVDGRDWPMAAVVIEVRSDRDPHPRVAFTDERGHFEMSGVIGELTVTALPQGAPAVRGRAEVASEQVTELRLTVEGSLETLSGRTVDGRGFPVPNVPLHVTGLRPDAPLNRTILSEEDGTFTTSALPSPPWRIHADASGYAPTVLDVFEPAPSIQLRMERGASVSGQLIDDLSSDGVPATVELTRAGLPPEILTQRTLDGSFSFTGVRAGHWTLTARSEVHVERSVAVDTSGVRLSDTELDPIRLTPSAFMEGTVVDALGAPLSGARVFTEHAPGRTVRTDAQGEFILPCAPGEVRLLAHHPAAGDGSTVARGLTGRETPGLVIHLDGRFDPERAASLPGRQRGVAMSVRRQGSSVVVDRVIAGSKAERAGLQPGDQILEIDGDAPESPSHALRLLRGAPTVPAVMRIARGDLTTLLIVEREVWLPD